MKLTGACRLVVRAGSHNDVNWRQTEPGPPPSMQDKGNSNSYHVIHGES